MKIMQKTCILLSLMVVLGSILLADRHFQVKEPVKAAYQIDQEMGRCTVQIRGASGGGTGVVIYQDDKKALVLTCFHVLHPDKEFTVSWHNGMYVDSISTPGKVHHADEKMDLAILETKPVWHKVAKVITAREYERELSIFQKCLVLGYPRNARSAHLTEGYLSDLVERNMIRISAPILYGNSGSGVWMNVRGTWKMIAIVHKVFNVDGDWAHPVPHMGMATNPVDLLEFLSR